MTASLSMQASQTPQKARTRPYGRYNMELSYQPLYRGVGESGAVWDKKILATFLFIKT